MTDSISTKIKFLESIGCGETTHQDRTLLQHLVDTYELLKDSPRHIALAGLFHSVYGTTYFKPKTISLDNRDVVIDIIGEEAENLAFMFCTIPHPRGANIWALEDIKLRDELMIIENANQLSRNSNHERLDFYKV